MNGADPMREVVVGYDVRVAPEPDDAHWTDERRAEYLLEPAVRRPLSVDEAVWLRPESSLVVGRGLTVETPKYRALEAACAAAKPGEAVVAITAWRGLGEREVGEPGEPSDVDAAWERLGWDVCDGFFPSALSNCGYSSTQREDLAHFTPALNEHGLFRELPPAFAFRDLANRRVPEHAPFSVLGLYRVA